MSKFLQAFLVFIVGGSIWGASDVGDPLLRKTLAVITKGDHALRVGNLRKAEARYHKALELVPGLPEGHLGLGRVAMQREQFQQALAEFRETERLYRADSANLLDFLRRRYHDAQVRATQIRRRVQMMEANIEFLGSAMEGSSGDSTAQQREKLRTLQDDVRRQSSEARRLEKIRPPQETGEDGVPGEVFFHIGNALLNLGRLEDAVAAWETCGERAPSHAVAFNNLAVAYHKLGRLEDAIVSLEKAEALGLRVNPTFKAELRRSRAALAQ